MKIKNKDRLVKRATEHKALDRFISQYYLSEDGPDAVFEGCLIGCLAIPSAVSAAKRRVCELVGVDEFPGWESVDEDQLIEQLEKEFGICRGLQRTAEALLMTLPEESRGRLGGFALSFAKALPLKVDITDELVMAWVESRDASYSGLKRQRIDPNTYAFVGDPVPFGGLVSFEGTEEQATKERAAFLDWLRRGAPRPRGSK